MSLNKKSIRKFNTFSPGQKLLDLPTGSSCVYSLPFVIIGPFLEAFINYVTYMAVLCHLGVECGYEWRPVRWF